MRKFYLLLALLLTVLGAGQVMAQETLTVYDGTKTNDYVPLYGYYADAYQKTEFIMPASELADMDGASITEMKYYSSNTSVSWGSAVFEVFLKEVETTTMTGFLGKEGATTVYTGSLSIASGEMVITFTEPFAYNGGNLLVGVYQTTKGSYSSASFYGVSQDNQTAWRGYNSSSLSSVSGSGQYFLPKTTFTYEAAAEGPALKVVGYNDGDTFAFGMVNPGAEKTLTLKNPGTAAVTVALAATGGFSVRPASVTIGAKEEAAVTLAAAEETATGVLTLTPDASGLDAISLNLTCTIKDPSKVFVDFNDNLLPNTDETGEWTTAGIGSYTTGSYSSSYVWDFSKGYAWYKSSTGSAGYLDYYYHSLVSPLMKFTEGETVIFKVKKEPQYSSYLGYLRVDYTTDGSAWTTAATFNDADLTSEWAEHEAAIPAAAKQIRFVAAGIALDDIYGGELSDAPVMEVTAADHAFGMISAAADMTFTIANKGKSALDGVEVVSDNAAFTVTDVPASIAAGETATVTVTMEADAVGVAQEGTITISAPDQETVTFNVSGYVIDGDLFTETFDANELPAGWETTGWTFANGEASGAYSSTRKQLITPALTVAEGEKMAVEVMKTRNSGCAMDIYVSKDGGDFTKLKTIADADLINGTYKVFFIEGLEAGSYKIRFDANDNAISAVNGFHLDQNAPQMAVAPEEGTALEAAFGKVTANAVKTFTVTNEGTGELVVNITSDSEVFTVEPATLTVTDEPQTFTVTFNYVEGNFGPMNGTITVTPTYNEEAAVTIAASAKALNPDAWDVDFEEGEFTLGWDATNWTVGKQSYTANPNTTYLAYSSARENAVLVTPRLQADQGDVIMFEGYFPWDDEGLKVEYSTDEKDTWVVAVLEGLTQSTESGYEGFYCPKDNGKTGRDNKLDMKFVAPASGFYYLRFTSTWAGTGIDNINGFKLAPKDHEAVIARQSIRSTFNQYTDYDVTVTVKEMAGKEEEMTAKFFVDGVQYGEDVTETVAAGSETTFTVTVRFDEVIEGNAYFVVSNDDMELTSEEVAITVKPAVVLDESVALLDMTTGYQDKVVVKYTAKKGWNTICMPFALADEDLTALFGEGWKVYELKGYSETDGLRFDVASRRYAGYPYVVYCENVPTIENPGYIVTYVSFSTVKNDSYGGATFQGTYAPMAAGEMEGKYGVVPATGQIKKGSAKATMKGFRAYFELPAGSSDAISAQFVDEDGTTTSISGVELNNILGGDIYDLNGRKMNPNSKLQPGVYVKDGKKIVVK